MILDGFGFSGYRSFGVKLAKIAPLKKINLIVGQNNVGKSNIINYLYFQYPYFLSKEKNRGSTRDQENPFTELDRHKSDKQVEHKVAYPLLTERIEEYIESKINETSSTNIDYLRNIASKVLNNCFINNEVCIWFQYKTEGSNEPLLLDVDYNKCSDLLDHHDWQMLWNKLTKQSGGSAKDHWIPGSIKSLAYLPSVLPKIEVIPAIRKIGKSGSQAIDFSGEGLIARLARIQNPPLNKLEDKVTFNNINKFVQDVIENPSANIEIPVDQDMILVKMDNKTLPLESLGTGLHEVIILAVASTILVNTIICAEEPELHLHPILQRKLVKYLLDNTSNQYIFTTHSAHLLDLAEASVFHVTQTEGTSIIEAVITDRQRSFICNDLGYKASDIIQSNCIIWVEGPSDRIYLNYWIHNKDPNLEEGIHYSIMFYGGRLCSHISALDYDELLEQEQVNDIVSTRKLNRHSVFIFDSDKKNSRARINKTKIRLKDEFNLGPGFAWETKGREIENYLEVNSLEKAILKVHKAAKKIVNKDKYSNLLEYEKKSGEVALANKIKVARYYVATFPADYRVLDLEERISEVVDFIRDVNA